MWTDPEGNSPGCRVKGAPQPRQDVAARDGPAKVLLPAADERFAVEVGEFWSDAAGKLPSDTETEHSASEVGRADASRGAMVYLPFLEKSLDS